MYSGRKDRISELAWVFGQHERNVLHIVCYALRELADLDMESMADPVRVSRAISSIINGHVSFRPLHKIIRSRNKCSRFFPVLKIAIETNGVSREKCLIVSPVDFYFGDVRSRNAT